MNNVLELRKELIQIFGGVKSKRLPLDRAHELNSTACKIINSVKLELVYAQLRKETPSIEFLATKRTTKK
jgi:hypothetical protein